MSIILDALKKLEQKRRQEAIPDITTVHMPEHQAPQAKKRAWPYIIAAALIVNAVVIALWMTKTFKEPPAVINETTVTGTAQANIHAGQTSPADAATPGPKAVIILEEKSGLDTADKKIAPGKKEPEKVITEEKVIPSEQAKTESPAKTVEPEKAAPAPANALEAIAPSSDEISRLHREIEDERASIKPPNVDSAVPTVPEQTVKHAAATEFSRLPEDVRKELSNLSISGHIYSNEPSARIVNINGLIFHEGEDVSNSLRVEEIAMDGVIFRYKQYRFVMRIF